MKKKKASEKTSYAVRTKWNNNNLTKVTYSMPKNLMLDFKEKCKAEKISQASIIRKAIENFLEKDYN